MGTFSKNGVKWWFLHAPGLFSIYTPSIGDLTQPPGFKCHCYKITAKFVLLVWLFLWAPTAHFFISTWMFSKHLKCDMSGSELLIFSHLSCVQLVSKSACVFIFRVHPAFSLFSPSPLPRRVPSSQPWVKVIAFLLLPFALFHSVGHTADSALVIVS